MNINRWILISSGISLLFVYNYMFSTEIRVTPNVKFLSRISTDKRADSEKTTQALGEVPKANSVTSVTLPIKWGDLGKRMVEDGVIDRTKFENALGALSDEDKKLLEAGNGQIVMTEANSRVLLDLLWAFGLANKNAVLDKGDIMKDPAQAGNYASTGGWTLARGDPMGHFSKYSYVTLDAAQQKMVENMAKGIYRPCCNNSTYFPDCNHGMAMLGLLELMAKNGISEPEAYKVALDVNSLWFPQTYEDISVYFAENGTSADKVGAATILGAEYSSASGYKQTRAQIKSLPQPVQGGGGCGV